MPSGRRPAPTHLRLLTGNRSRRPINHEEPEVVSECPLPTLELTDAEQKEFDAVSKLLAEMQLLATVDAGSMTLYAKAMVEFADAEKVIEDEGPYYENDGPAGRQIKLHPAMNVKDRAAGKIFKYLLEFGMTPASRTKVKVDKKKPKDKVERFFKDKA